MRNVCIVCDGHWDQLQGGAEYQLLLLSEALARRGYHVDYVYTDRGTPLCDSIVHRTPLRLPALVRRLAYPYQILLAPQLFKRLDALEPDLIINRVGSAFTGICAWFGKRRSVPVVWHIADITDVKPPPLPRNRTRPLAWIDRKCLNYGIAHSKEIIAQANYQDELLQVNFGRSASAVIPNFHPAPAHAPLKDERPLVVWVANIKPKKRPEAFIQLANRLAGKSDARFVMIGRPAGGRYQQAINRLLTASAHVEFLGECGIERVNEILERAWVFVNTSMVEGFPNTFIQAWLRNVAVVSLDFDPDGLLRELGLGRKSGDLDRLCEDVQELIENPIAREKLTRAALEHAHRHHSVDGSVDRIAALIESACIRIPEKVVSDGR